MKWKRLETHREKRERIQRDAEQQAAEAQKTQQQNDRLAEKTRAYYEADHHRNDSEGDYQVYEAAYHEAFAHLGGEERAFWCALNRLRDKRSAELEPLVSFLERDLWTSGSGYGKADAIRYLKHLGLSNDTEERLRRVVLNAVDGRDRRDRHYCKLARKVDAPELRAALRERMTGNDPNVRRRAAWMLAACEQKNERSRHEENHD